MRSPIHVTRAFLPPMEEYVALVGEVWATGQVTNQGPLARRLEAALDGALDTHGTLLAGNGTIAIQLAVKALGLKGEVITTPYSYAATTTSILWEGLVPVFADIDPRTFCIDPARIVERITPGTSAILATHVYGIPCDVIAIEAIARQHGLKVIYDAAHVFGTTFNGKGLASYGDVATLSFHATKLFHTGEGGAMVCSDPLLRERLKLMRSFGHIDDDHFVAGVNGKNSELHAAMGLAVLPHMPAIMQRRKEQWLRYAELLDGKGLQLLHIPEGTGYNHAYFPVVFADGAMRERVTKTMNAENIFPRRYFYPSLDRLPYLNDTHECPLSIGIAERVVCLPLYHALSESEQRSVVDTLLKAL
ncbi:MAG: DegT/DnrJ/EryC1/StrS family aminotransferase [Flavobacteriales bacterium]